MLYHDFYRGFLLPNVTLSKHTAKGQRRQLLTGSAHFCHGMQGLGGDPGETPGVAKTSTLLALERFSRSETSSPHGVPHPLCKVDNPGTVLVGTDLPASSLLGDKASPYLLLNQCNSFCKR